MAHAEARVRGQARRAIHRHATVHPEPEGPLGSGSSEIPQLHRKPHGLGDTLRGIHQSERRNAQGEHQGLRGP
eukprot:12234051-Heterocapsa_arctica.AAC.1